MLSAGTQLSCPDRKTVTFWLHSLHLFVTFLKGWDLPWISVVGSSLFHIYIILIPLRDSRFKWGSVTVGTYKRALGVMVWGPPHRGHTKPSPGSSSFVPCLTRLLRTQRKAECFSGWHWSILGMIMWVLWVPWGRDCGFPYVLSCSKIVAGILWTRANKSKPVFPHALQNLLHFGTGKPRTAHCRLCQIIPPLHTWTLLHFPHT